MAIHFIPNLGGLRLPRVCCKGKAAVVHTSFSRLAYAGSPQRFLDELLDRWPNLLFPAFCWDSSTLAPASDWVGKNGLIYERGWISPRIPFDPLRAGIDEKMGILPRTAWNQHVAYRSGHPWHSWVALGPRADWLTRDHDWERAHQPLERLAALDGWVFLLGVSLKYCTAFHLAEEMAGRRPFIRWAIDRTGKVRRIRVGGCANWFERFEEPLRPILHRFWIGRAQCMAFPLRRFLTIVSNEIQLNPDNAVCSSDCLKCRDARAGGPCKS